MDQPTQDQSPGEAGAVTSAGWYADPDDPEELRWWDGYAWGPRSEGGSAGAADRAAPGTDLNPASISNPDATRYAQILQPDLNEAVDDSVLARSTRIGLIIAGVVIAVFLIGVGAVLLSRGGDDAQDGGLEAVAVADTLEAEGLPIGDVEVYTESTDPDGLLGRPGLYISRADFVDTTLEIGPEPAMVAGGAIEVYETTADAVERDDVISSGSSAKSIQAGVVVVRLSPEMRAADVATYERALEANYSDSGSE